MKLKYIVIPVLLYVFEAFSQDSLVISSVRVKITYNKTKFGYIEKDSKGGTDRIRIDRLTIDLTDLDIVYWQDLIKLIKVDNSPSFIHCPVCGTPSFIWEIILSFKNNEQLILATTEEKFDSHSFYFSEDAKRRYLKLDVESHKNFRLKLLNLLKHELQYDREDFGHVVELCK